MASVLQFAGKRRLARAFVASCAILGCLPTASQARTNWAAVTSPNFHVISDGGERLGVQVASDLERVRWVFFQGPGPAGERTVRPITVLALQDRGSIRDLISEPQDSRDVVGYVNSSAERNFIVVDTRRRQSGTADALYSTYFDVFTRSHLGRMPTCVTRGMAIYWGNIRIERGQVQLGRLLPILQSLQAEGRAGSMLSVRDALDMGFAIRGGISQSPIQRVRFDAQCYALVHYLAVGEARDRMRPLFDRYLQLVQTGMGAEDAFAAASIDIAEWDEVLQDHYRGRNWQYLRFPAPEAPDASDYSIRELGDAEALAWQGQLLSSHGDWEAAVEAVQASLELDPGLVRSREVYADLLLREDASFPEALALIDELMASGGYSYRLPFMKVQAAPQEQHEDLLRESLAMDPNYAPALGMLADLLIDRGDSPDEALELVRRAMRIDAYNPDHVYRLGRAYLYSRQPDRARSASALLRSWRPARRAEGRADALDEEIQAYQRDAPEVHEIELSTVPAGN